MAGTRQPTANVIAKGRKHLTREEIDRRLDAEHGVLVPETAQTARKKPLTAKPPHWLPENLKKEFRAIGKALIAANLYSNLDADTLGRYLLARVDYLNAEKRANYAIVTGDAEASRDWSAIQERYFKQCRNCANDMGLTIASRCRLVIPQNTGAAAPDDDKPGESEFMRRLRERQAAALASSE